MILEEAVQYDVLPLEENILLAMNFLILPNCSDNQKTKKEVKGLFFLNRGMARVRTVCLREAKVPLDVFSMMAVCHHVLYFWYNRFHCICRKDAV